MNQNPKQPFDPKLTRTILHLHALLDVSLSQLWGTAPGWPDLGDDPMGFVRRIDAVRTALESDGIAVPQFVDPDIDPLGHMTEWRDFLAKFVTVH